MFHKNHTDSDSNFWISYADLMAGLLFVFILLIGAIVSKSSLLKTELFKKEASLLEKDKEIHQQDSLITKSKDMLSAKERILKLKISEIDRLNRMLLQSKIETDVLNNKVILVQNLFDKNKAMLKENQKSLAQSKAKLKTYEGKVVLLSNALTQAKDTVKVKDEKLLSLLASMDANKTKYNTLVAKLQKQKSQIKSLTGIKLQVVSALKEALGSKINIDKRTGSLKLASNVLFPVGKATLKDDSKIELKKAFEEYIGTLITNDEIKPHLDKIIIEGHTDSDGGYIYNLKLSQDRALAVMQYFLTLDFSKKHNIKSLMTASGRAYLDPIIKEGKEDKEASRRIEIKFKLKNDDAMHEIEKILDAK
ncbi:MAG: hypothetical protein DSZ12_03640 [Sulfurovum sp.]|nr:MAG: hypothetical protein DSZ12_03640 [Sulfurovum sp.]